MCLDLIGRLPTRDELDAYLSDSSDDKKQRLVDRLLAGEPFIDYWTHRLAQLLRIRSVPGGRDGAEALDGWLREQLREGTGFDQIARHLLTATGDSHAVGPAYFSRLSNDARQQAELVSNVFLGVRLQCANCHDHPLDRWTPWKAWPIVLLPRRRETFWQEANMASSSGSLFRAAHKTAPVGPDLRDGRGFVSGFQEALQNKLTKSASGKRRSTFGLRMPLATGEMR